MIREAELHDARAIVDIYDHYIETSTCTFELDRINEREMASRMAAIAAGGHPFLVYETEGRVVGYAYLSSWKSRAAYARSVEASIYVDHTMRGRGIGSSLYTDLIGCARERGYHVLIGGIALPNEASVALHERLGFVPVARFREVGFKFGGWVDVGYWQLTLDSEPSNA